VVAKTEAFHSKLRDLAESRLSLYIREMGEDFYAKLIANKANWRAGYVPAHDCYWCIPQTDKGLYVVGPFTAVKWTEMELEAFGVVTDRARALDELTAVSQELGLE
jgi:hypothetical protein